MECKVSEGMRQPFASAKPDPYIHTTVPNKHRSSSPMAPLAPLSLAQMRKQKAERASIPPTRQEMVTRRVLSTLGTPHVSFEYFSVANYVSQGEPYWRMTEVHNCSRIVQLAFTQRVIASTSGWFVQTHVVLVNEHDDFKIKFSMHKSCSGSILEEQECSWHLLRMLEVKLGQYHWSALRSRQRKAKPV